MKDLKISDLKNTTEGEVLAVREDQTKNYILVDDMNGSFQQRVRPWLIACFGKEVAENVPERNFRFIEEALELVQSLGCTKEEVLELVDYVYSRPVGEPYQEVGGTMVTLAALCLATGLNMTQNGETELARINTPKIIEKIRRKQATKPKHSPLPGQA